MLAYTTRLSAVNTMLGVIGEAPINTLTGPVTADVASAVSVLDEIVLELLTEGFDFNHEASWPLMADVSGSIPIPSDILDLRPVSSQRRLIARGGRLYDRDRRTFAFTPGETIDCEVVLRLSFDDMPEAARRYATIRAARIFANRTVGDQLTDAFTAQDERSARNVFRKSTTRVARVNPLRSSAVMRILDRSR